MNTNSSSIIEQNQKTSAQIEQETTLHALHIQFQQLCYAYGALAVTKQSFKNEKFRWFSEDCAALAEVAMEIHRKNGGA
jgi:hypothetical protein